MEGDDFSGGGELQGTLLVVDIVHSVLRGGGISKLSFRENQ